MDKIKNIKEEASHSQYLKAEMEPWPSNFDPLRFGQKK